MKRYESLIDAEAKSRIYLALIGRWLNKAKLSSESYGEMRGKERVDYSRQHIESTIDEMAREDNLLNRKIVDPRETKLIELKQPKSSVTIFKSDLDVYLEFLKDTDTETKEKNLEEIKEIILAFAPVYNMVGVRSSEKKGNVLIDIPLSILAREYFMKNSSNSNSRKHLKHRFEKAFNTNGSLKNPFFPLVLAFHRRLQSYPSVEIGQNLTEKIGEYEEVFIQAFLSGIISHIGEITKDKGIMKGISRFNRMLSGDMDEIMSNLRQFNSGEKGGEEPKND
ncbi:hypothetical protein AKJ41_03210 [candidate division MSBL1 archaeon SCGC-AAA259O05]|uniref:Uncharacterized protein n=1 Tax=candidate division MSBL1 archaeon SCGC-AAA259O05 TaxID=1698271 RepID=A0A133V3F1_9EURY|nr:hypothetical protein AKJ41_03210 [candidate division MSBL1 archaeon SCGC-AAA259O05]